MAQPKLKFRGETIMVRYRIPAKIADGVKPAARKAGQRPSEFVAEALARAIKGK